LQILKENWWRERKAHEHYLVKLIIEADN
jgi:hypothetical protein